MSRDVQHAHFDLLLHFWFVGQAMNRHTKFEVSSDTLSRDMEGIPKFKKISHVTQDTPLLTQVCVFFWFAGLELNPHTKLQVCSFNHSRDIKGVPKLRKVCHVTYNTPILTYFFIFFYFEGLTINLHTKFEVSNFICSRDIKESQNYKSRSRDVVHALFYLLLYFGLQARRSIRTSNLKFLTLSILEI